MSADGGARARGRGAPGSADLLGWLAAALVPLAYSLQRVMEPDAFWNLAGGKLLLGGVFPSTNTFSHTFPDHPWEFTSWLFGALLAALHKVLGVYGINLAAAFFAAATFLVLTAAAKRTMTRFRWSLWLPLLFLGVASAHGRFQARGDIATMLGLALLGLLLAAKPKRAWLCAFALAAVWTNLHAGVVYGLLAILAAAAGHALSKEREELKGVLLVGAAFLVGTLLSPASTWRYFFGHVNDYAAFPIVITELRRPPPATFPVFYFFAALCAVAALYALRKRDWGFVALSLSYFMPLFGSRFVVIPVVLTLPGLAKYAGIAWEEGAGRKAALAFFGVAALCGAWAANAATRQTWELGVLGGVGETNRFAPVAASDFLQQHGIPGDFYNEFNFGGYLAGRFYPERRVFIDGRGMAYPLSHFARVVEHPFESLEGQLLDYPRAEIAVIQRRSQGQEFEIAFDALGWPLLFADRTTYVFAKPGSRAESVGAPYALRILRLWLGEGELFAAATADPARAHAELELMRGRELAAPYDFYKLATVARLTGDAALADEFFRKGLAANPGHQKLLAEYEKFKGNAISR